MHFVSHFVKMEVVWVSETMKKQQGKQAIARLFGVTSRRIEQFTSDGIITPIQTKPRCMYDVEETVQRYIRYLSDKANGREKKQEDSDSESKKAEADARYKTAKAEIAELELAELRGDLHRAQDVEEITTDHVLRMRSMIMAMPGKLAVDVSVIDNAQEAAERIRRECERILENAADFKYEAGEYKRRVRDRRGWGENAGNDEE